MELVRFTQNVSYGGHAVASTGVVNLTLKAQYSELSNTMRLMQMLNNDILVIAKVVNMPKAIRLGYFRIKNVAVAGDGTSKIKLSGITDSVEVDNFAVLPGMQDDVCEFKVRYQSEIEIEDEE